jgi:hypothetical protein
MDGIEICPPVMVGNNVGSCCIGIKLVATVGLSERTVWSPVGYILGSTVGRSVLGAMDGIDEVGFLVVGENVGLIEIEGVHEGQNVNGDGLEDVGRLLGLDVVGRTVGVNVVGLLLGFIVGVIVGREGFRVGTIVGL